MNMIILRNGRLIDPANTKDLPNTDLWIHGGTIIEPQDRIPDNAEIFDLQSKWIVPGFIDMHVHLREPGEEYKEDIISGTRAAAAGGFTAVVCMPNTSPVNDNGSITKLILERAQFGSARVYPIGAISAGSKGNSLAEFGELKAAGAIGVSDDGLPVFDSQLMRRALEYSASHGLLVISHSEESRLSSGCMNEGIVSTTLGLKGIPNAAESIMVYREIALSELTGVPIHIAHVSTRESIELIRAAKARGTRVTAETSPHYFTLTDEAVTGYDTNAKMNPPLRSQEDREEIRKALFDGTLDAIATDHAPHSILEKEVEFSLAANGIIGLETALPLTLQLVRDKVISEEKMFSLLSTRPAAILGVEGGDLAIGKKADITVIDPEKTFTYSRETILSKSHNSPFLGWEMQGKAVLTMVEGTITHNELNP